LLQAYDFLYLCEHFDCTVQMGGSDQWGNILSGKDLIRRILGKPAEGITFPLLTTASGKKFGKTEEGAVWLDAARTSPYQMYQYWLQTADADAGRFLRLFTFLDRERIEALEAEALRRPEAREAQRVLAVECTTIVHGQDAVRSVEAATRILFSASDEAPTPETIALLAREVPVTDLPQAELAAGIPLVDLMVRTKLAESKGSARKLIEGGGVYLNNHHRPFKVARRNSLAHGEEELSPAANRPLTAMRRRYRITFSAIRNSSSKSSPAAASFSTAVSIAFCAAGR
jgi:tyrosyl-tRNA synthetase